MLASKITKGVLQKDVHGRLMADAGNVAQDANIVPTTLERSMLGFCSEGEITYTKNFRRHSKDEMYGLALVGRKYEVSVIDRMAVTAAALLRNFIRARVVTLNQFVSGDEELARITCLLVPNFFIEKSMGGSLPNWKTGDLLDLLVQRQTAGKQTVVYITDMEVLEAEYGLAIRQHIETNFYVRKA